MLRGARLMSYPKPSFLSSSSASSSTTNLGAELAAAEVCSFQAPRTPLFNMLQHVRNLWREPNHTYSEQHHQGKQGLWRATVELGPPITQGLSGRRLQDRKLSATSSPSYESMLTSVQPATGLQEAAWRGHQDVDALLAGTRLLRLVLVSGSAKLERLRSARPGSFRP